jgi:hypothetical protein
MCKEKKMESNGASGREGALVGARALGAALFNGARASLPPPSVLFPLFSCESFSCGARAPSIPPPRACSVTPASPTHVSARVRRERERAAVWPPSLLSRAPGQHARAPPPFLGVLAAESGGLAYALPRRAAQLAARASSGSEICRRERAERGREEGANRRARSPPISCALSRPSLRPARPLPHNTRIGVATAPCLLRGGAARVREREEGGLSAAKPNCVGGVLLSSLSLSRARAKREPARRDRAARWLARGSQYGCRTRAPAPHTTAKSRRRLQPAARN